MHRQLLGVQFGICRCATGLVNYRHLAFVVDLPDRTASRACRFQGPTNQLRQKLLVRHLGRLGHLLQFAEHFSNSLLYGVDLLLLDFSDWLIDHLIAFVVFRLILFAAKITFT